MSADNWDVCPRCIAKAHAAHEKEEERVSDMYGKVPVDDFDAARAELKPVDPEDFRTLREDYEWYVQDEEIHGVYKCQCTAEGCGLTGSAEITKALSV